MVREKAGSKAFREGIHEVAPKEREATIGSLSFDEVRKVVPRLADEFRTDLEAISNAPERAKQGITEALTKDLEDKVSQAKGIVDAWLIIKEAEIAGLLGADGPSQGLESLDDLYSQSRENPKLGSLRDEEVKRVLPNLENIFRKIHSDIEKKIPEMGVLAAREFVQEKVAILAHELEQARGALTAWFAMLPHKMIPSPGIQHPARATGSVTSDESMTSRYAKAAELLREQTRVSPTGPLERRGTAPLVEGELDIDSSKVTLQNLIATLQTAVQEGPKSGKEFLANIHTQYELFKKAAKIYFELHEAITSRYRGKHLEDALREFRIVGSDLQHLVGGVKSLMYPSPNLKAEMGTANVSIIEDRVKPIKDELDQLWANIGYSVGATPSVWRGSRQFLTNPKKGK